MRVPNILQSHAFLSSFLAQALLYKSLFLTALALRRWVNKIHAMSWYKDLLNFHRDLDWVRICPQPKFPAKYETVNLPTRTSSFPAGGRGTFISLRPVGTLKAYMDSIIHYSGDLFTSPNLNFLCQLRTLVNISRTSLQSPSLTQTWMPMPLKRYSLP